MVAETDGYIYREKLGAANARLRALWLIGRGGQRLPSLAAVGDWNFFFSSSQYETLNKDLQVSQALGWIEDEI